MWSRIVVVALLVTMTTRMTMTMIAKTYNLLSDVSYLPPTMILP
jgi:hypothetical protein